MSTPRADPGTSPSSRTRNGTGARDARGPITEVMVTDPTVDIDEVEGRPVVVVERLPDAVVVVHRHRVADVHLLDGALHVVELPLEQELGRLHTDHDESLVRVLVGPRPDVR